MKKFLVALLLAPSLSHAAKVSEALLEIRPGAEWVLYGDDYNELIWLDKLQTKPTRKEVDDMKKKLDQAEPFPSAQEQLDALLEGGKAATDMKERIRRAKKKEPKE